MEDGTMSNNIQVGVSDSSTDWGIIGKATTERGAMRVGKRWGEAHTANNPGYSGYRYTVTMHYADQPPHSIRV